MEILVEGSGDLKVALKSDEIWEKSCHSIKGQTLEDSHYVILKFHIVFNQILSKSLLGQVRFPSKLRNLTLWIKI